MLTPHTSVNRSWQAALKAGKPTTITMDSKGTLADGLAVTCVGPRSFRVAKDLVDTLVPSLP
jgi:threonine dehydratase